ncbi:helix-turn-helix transcriptional regulator [Streptomyces sp.]|uniref:helix-turn-helix transcriptional regulator n=1 Tax=Streptomyces sp. TaxID=1931 RepID=UPI0025E4163B|nr:helix-turn-helix transcriptional regulator [Streptomyces sp.]
MRARAVCGSVPPTTDAIVLSTALSTIGHDGPLPRIRCRPSPRSPAHGRRAADLPPEFRAVPGRGRSRWDAWRATRPTIGTLGVTPLTYLRNVRLDRVHADLLTGATGVTEAAGRWGFSHLNRFSAAYRRRFGAAPSQTRAGVGGHHLGERESRRPRGTRLCGRIAWPSTACVRRAVRLPTGGDGAWPRIGRRGRCAGRCAPRGPWRPSRCGRRPGHR